LDAWPFGRPPARIGEAKPEDAEERADVGKNMDDSYGVRAERKHRGPEDRDVMSQPAMVVRKIIPKDVSCDSNGERRENAERSTDGMGNQGLENIAVPVRKHFERGRAEKVKRCENHEARRDAEKKSFDGMVSKRPEVESAEKIAEVGADTTRDESREAEIARAEAFEW
jgi:hypothetical protein